MTTWLHASIPQQVYRPEQVREFEAEAAERAGIDLWELMQRAGAAAWEALQAELGQQAAITVLCGRGNNGGDGYVLASLAKQAGYSVRVCASGFPHSNDARRALQLWLDVDGEVEALPDWQDGETDWLVDALLGTGVQNDVHGELLDCIASVNESALPVLAIDVPSGLHADTGEVLGVAIHASLTVTFVGMKRGLLTGQAADYVGHLYFSDLGIQREFRLLTEPAAWLLQSEQLQHDLKPRPRVSHKGDFGHVLVIGGSRGYAGAAQMAGLSALRVGAGEVSVICEPGQELLIGQQPELMVIGAHANDEVSERLLDQATVIAIGPGLGQGDWASGWWQRFCQRSVERDIVAVVDADALNLMAIYNGDSSMQPAEGMIYTPHPGEAARLLAASTADIQRNRWLAVETLAEQLQGTVVLKGAGSLVAGPDSDVVAVCTHGNAAMATAGMGDVLTGVIAGLAAQRQQANLPRSLTHLTGLGVLLHACAGDAAARQTLATNRQPLARGLLATDLIAFLPMLASGIND